VVSQQKSSSGSNDMIDLNRYWLSLLRSKWVIVAFAFALACLAYFVATKLDNVYRATATIMIEGEQSRVSSIDDVYGPVSGGREYLETQYQIMQSRPLLERVTERLELHNHPALDPREQGEDASTMPRSDAVRLVARNLGSNISVSAVRNTYLVKLSMNANDPELAATIANTIAAEYINSKTEASLQATGQVAELLTGRLEGLRENLRKSEERLQEYRESADLLGAGDIVGKEKLEELNLRHLEAGKSRSVAEAMYAQVKRLGENPSLSQLLNIPAILAHPSVRGPQVEQNTANRRVAELGKRYGPKHPKMIAAQSALLQASNDLKVQAVSVARGFASAYESALQTERDLGARVADARKRFQGISRKEFQLVELERDVAANRQLYDVFLNKAKETEEAGGLQSAHAKIIEPALPPIYPIKPKKKLLAIIAGVVGVMIGAFIAILLEALNRSLRSPEDVEDKLGAPLLGYLPLERKNKSKLPFEGFRLEEIGGFSEAIRTVRTSLMLHNIEKQSRIVVVTSTVPGEGKSTVSLNLARVLGQVERVLLIDADMRRPTMSRVIDLPRGSAGLAELASGEAELADVVYRMDGHEVDVISSGVIPSNPLELLESSRLEEVLAQVRGLYDRVIIDCAPILAVSDALVLSTKADELVYVVKASATDSNLVEKGLRRLKEINAPLVGVILNQVNVAKASREGGYYTAYYENYGYSSEEEFNAQSAYQKTREGEHKYRQSKPLKAADS